MRFVMKSICSTLLSELEPLFSYLLGLQFLPPPGRLVPLLQGLGQAELAGRRDLRLTLLRAREKNRFRVGFRHYFCCRNSPAAILRFTLLAESSASLADASAAKTVVQSAATN